MPRASKARTAADALAGLSCRWRARPMSPLAGLGQLSLEQFSVAADRDQFGRDPAADRRARVFGARATGRRLVDHLARRR